MAMSTLRQTLRRQLQAFTPGFTPGFMPGFPPGFTPGFARNLNQSVAARGLWTNTDYRNLKDAEFQIDHNGILVHSIFNHKSTNKSKPKIDKKFTDAVLNTKDDIKHQENWGKWPDIDTLKKTHTLTYRLRSFEVHSAGKFGKSEEDFDNYTELVCEKAEGLTMKEKLEEIFDPAEEKIPIGGFMLYGMKREEVRKALKEKCGTEPLLLVYYGRYEMKDLEIIREVGVPFDIEMKDVVTRESIKDKNNERDEKLYLCKYLKEKVTPLVPKSFIRLKKNKDGSYTVL